MDRTFAQLKIEGGCISPEPAHGHSTWGRAGLLILLPRHDVHVALSCKYALALNRLYSVPGPRISKPNSSVEKSDIWGIA